MHYIADQIANLAFTSHFSNTLSRWPSVKISIKEKGDDLFIDFLSISKQIDDGFYAEALGSIFNALEPAWEERFLKTFYFTDRISEMIEEKITPDEYFEFVKAISPEAHKIIEKKSVCNKPIESNEEPLIALEERISSISVDQTEESNGEQISEQKWDSKPYGSPISAVVNSVDTKKNAFLATYNKQGRNCRSWVLIIDQSIALPKIKTTVTIQLSKINGKKYTSNNNDYAVIVQDI